ncbi:hypothetical protein [Streptomyces sp. NPDC020983]|uniref:hypothetical protein n=1 Tax=Streptomyces sp. NPDC020983 TaxID=3365106 RepID=UPI00379C5EF1
MPLTLMWEAAARPGAGPALLQWARAAAAPGPYLRREFFTAPGDRVLVLTWWPDDGQAEDLPSPPEALTRREVHRWRFTSVGVEEP